MEQYCPLAKHIKIFYCKAYKNLCNKVLLLFCFLPITVTTLYAQNIPQLDSLLNKSLIQKDVNSIEQKNTSRALSSFLMDNIELKSQIRHAVQNYIKGHDSIDIVYVYRSLNYSVSSFDPGYGQQFLMQGLQYISANNKKSLADYYGNIGADYAIMGMDVLALKNSLKALDYIKHYKLDLGKDSTQYQYVRRLLATNIAQLYIQQKNITLAIKYNNESVALGNKHPNDYRFKFLKIVEGNNAAEIEYSLGNNVLSKKYLMRSLAICRKLKETEREIEVLIKLGDYTTNYSEKLHYHEEAYRLATTIKHANTFSINSYLKLTNTYVKFAKNSKRLLSANLGVQYNKSYFLQKAATLLNETELQIKAVNSKKDLAEMYLLYAQLNQLQQNYKEAYTYSEKYHKLNDSVYSQENKNKLAALQNINEIEIKNHEIKLSQATVKAKEKQFWYLAIVLALVSIIVVVLFYQNQLRKKKNIALDKANRLKVQFFNILNHDLRSPLGELIQFMLLQQEAPDLLDDEKKLRLEAQSLQSAKKLLSSMEDLLLWGKGQIENFKPKFETITINDLFNEMQEIFISTNDVLISYETENGLILLSDKNYLKTIMRNLTSNAIKVLEHTNYAQIVWRAQKVNGKIVLSITDNGPGGTDEQFKALYDEKEAVGIKNGLGLHLVRDMAKAIGYQVTVNSTLANGITITLISQ